MHDLKIMLDISLFLVYISYIPTQMEDYDEVP